MKPILVTNNRSDADEQLITSCILRIRLVDPKAAVTAGARAASDHMR